MHPYPNGPNISPTWVHHLVYFIERMSACIWRLRQSFAQRHVKALHVEAHWTGSVQPQPSSVTRDISQCYISQPFV